MRDDHITLGHGGGGVQSERLLREIVFPALGIEARAMDDSALLDVPAARLAFTTDSFVVQPLEFPGGDIGRLAVCGTVNDLATAAARPLALSLALILEEGFPIARLQSICGSIAAAAAEAGVAIMAGDTKVIERHTGAGMMINTAGIGVITAATAPRLAHARPGDAILINGSIADHGAAVLAARGDYGIAGPLASDAAPLTGLVAAVLDCGAPIHVLKDPTRGGVAMSLHEIAQASAAAIEIDEQALPIAPPVRAFCDLLGFDPLEIANEGKMIVVCPEDGAPQVVQAMRAHPLGREAVQIGRVTESDRPRVILNTSLGGRRVVAVPTGELLPRIC